MIGRWVETVEAGIRGSARTLACFTLVAICLASIPARPATPAINAGGDSHNVALATDGTVRTWGSDSYGQLGIGRQLVYPVPTLSGISGVKSISAGFLHTVALKNDGSVWTWGLNDLGQLGDGTQTDRPTPVQVSGLTGVVVVSAGQFHTVALKSDGSVWAWGDNGYGQLGDGTLASRLTPVQVNGLTGAVAVSAGSYHTVALKSDGSVWTWGSNAQGQLGDGTQASRLTPVQVSGLTSVVAVSASGDLDIGRTFALKSDGSVWAWGDNQNGALGDGTMTRQPTPVRVVGLTSVVAISAAVNHTVALKNDGSVWTWGDNGLGQLGDGTLTQRSTPIQVSGLAGVMAISAGYSYTVALKADGSIWAWGADDQGELGDGSTVTSRATPVQVIGLSGVVAISAGAGHTLALKNDASVWAWGDDSKGQLGINAPVSSPVPVALSGLTGVVAVAAGGYHTVALKADGSVWAWGNNSFFQLGDGTYSDRSAPVQVRGLAGVAAISAGLFHTVALKSDGSVWAWGDNRHGELGDGTTTGGATPVQVIGLSGVVAISAGPGHTVAVKNDGSVWAWGANDVGQLGDGTTTQRTAPTQVSGLAGVVAISAGGGYHTDGHTVAVKNDGTVWAWGDNSFGGLGDGTTIQRSTPVQVSGLSGVAAISTGEFHTVALKSDGSVWAWGTNYSGQLGDGSTTDRLTPVQVNGLTGVVAITAGYEHAAALKSDGTVREWGANQNGQLGDGTFAIRTKAVVVLHENGSGSIQTNDWFLDLNPTITATIPSDSIPAFLTVATGSVANTLRANAQFRPQDVGNPIHVFAYAPLSLVQGAAGQASDGTKDGVTCVLAQLTPSGSLQQSSAANLQPYVSHVVTTQGQAITVLTNVPNSQIAGATFCVGTGATGTQSVSTGNNVCVATVPGPQLCPPPNSSNPSPANLPGALSGLWWNQNESGWGIHFTQRGTNVFAAWYVYDTSGNPKWYVSTCAMNGGATGTAGTCSGAIFEVNGPTFFSPPFDTSLVHAVNSGNLQVAFQNADNASMTYSGVAGQTRTVAITRQPLASGTTSGVNYTDIWWGGQSQSGWGMAITQQANTAFLAWYVYDNSGKPMWYVATCIVTGTTCAGNLLRTTGPPFGPSFSSSQVQSFTAGTVSVNFTDGNNATLNYTVNGVSGSKSITRQLF